MIIEGVLVLNQGLPLIKTMMGKKKMLVEEIKNKINSWANEIGFPLDKLIFTYNFLNFIKLPSTSKLIPINRYNKNYRIINIYPTPHITEMPYSSTNLVDIINHSRKEIYHSVYVVGQHDEWVIFGRTVTNDLVVNYICINAFLEDDNYKENIEIKTKKIMSFILEEINKAESRECYYNPDEIRNEFLCNLLARGELGHLPNTIEEYLERLQRHDIDNLPIFEFIESSKNINNIISLLINKVRISESVGFEKAISCMSKIENIMINHGYSTENEYFTKDVDITPNICILHNEYFDISELHDYHISKILIPKNFLISSEKRIRAYGEHPNVSGSVCMGTLADKFANLTTDGNLNLQDLDDILDEIESMLSIINYDSSYREPTKNINEYREKIEYNVADFHPPQAEQQNIRSF